MVVGRAENVNTALTDLVDRKVQVPDNTQKVVGT